MSKIKNLSSSNPVPKDLARTLGDGGIKHILAVMWLSYHDLKKEHKFTISTHEDVITEEWYAKIYGRWSEENRASVVRLMLIPYTQYPDNTLAKKRGKIPTIDFCFRAWDKAEGYFGAECKKLCGSNIAYAKEYVVNGVRRYVTGKYGSKSTISTMVGYVMKGNISDSVKQIEGLLTTENIEQNITRELFETNPQYKSIHIRTLDSKKIILHHLFFDFVVA